MPRLTKPLPMPLANVPQPTWQSKSPAPPSQTVSGPTWNPHSAVLPVQAAPQSSWRPQSAAPPVQLAPRPTWRSTSRAPVQIPPLGALHVQKGGQLVPLVQPVSQPTWQALAQASPQRVLQPQSCAQQVPRTVQSQALVSAAPPIVPQPIFHSRSVSPLVQPASLPTWRSQSLAFPAQPALRPTWRPHPKTPVQQASPRGTLESQKGAERVPSLQPATPATWPPKSTASPCQLVSQLTFNPQSKVPTAQLVHVAPTAPIGPPVRLFSEEGAPKGTWGWRDCKACGRAGHWMEYCPFRTQNSWDRWPPGHAPPTLAKGWKWGTATRNEPLKMQGGLQLALNSRVGGPSTLDE